MSRFTRYIFRGDFSIKKMIVKPSAYSLGKCDSLSVCFIEGISNQEIWSIGKECVQKLRTDGKTIKARGDFDKSIVERLPSIELVHRPLPQHERHYQIEKWPTEEHLITHIQHELAKHSKLEIISPS